MKQNSGNLIQINFRLPREQIEFIRYLQENLKFKTRSDVLRQLIEEYMLSYIATGSYDVKGGIDNED